MAALDPPPCFMGGYAEDALLAGTVTRPHDDIDWVLPRRELAVRVAQAERLGFTGFETWGEASRGEPFYLFARNDDLRLELGIADETDGALLLKVHKLFFDVGAAAAPAGYQVYLPGDMFDFPSVELDGVAIHAASPLALYQMRVGIAQQGSFGPLSQRQLDSMSKLKEKFFPERSEVELVPRIERLT